MSFHTVTLMRPSNQSDTNNLNFFFHLYMEVKLMCFFAKKKCCSFFWLKITNIKITPPCSWFLIFFYCLDLFHYFISTIYLRTTPNEVLNGGWLNVEYFFIIIGKVWWLWEEEQFFFISNEKTQKIERKKVHWKKWSKLQMTLFLLKVGFCIF